jgi:glycosyltransferase involved in cell wall biosynthesis
MDWANKCAVVIPCLNEARAIESLVTAVRAHIPTVIVVDDGSADQTAALAQKAGAEVIRLEQTSGKGAALNAGWRRAFEREFKWALTMDGDGQHSPNDIPGLLALAEKEGATLVVGNRMTNTSQMPWLRRKVNHWMSRRLSQMAGQPLPDSQCGFRLMKLDVWSTLPLETTHFEIESELLLAFVTGGHDVHFVPIEVIYKNERSKIHPLCDALRWFRWRRRERRTISNLKSKN